MEIGDAKAGITRHLSSVLRRPSSVLWLLLAVLCPPSSVLRAETRYVSLTGGHIPPYTNWAMAATNIQAAIDASVSNDVVLVTNGVYSTGGRVVYGTMTNRVAITKPVRVCSVNGPDVTIIAGRPSPVSGNDGAPVRCVYIGANAVLSGFTLTNGYTKAVGDYYKERSGGGVWCESSALVSNCVLVGNSASGYGGGSYDGTLSRCVLAHNTAISGGGSYTGIQDRCTFFGNSADAGGGAHNSLMLSCALVGNLAFSLGGGARNATLKNCTLTGNSAPRGGGSSGGSLYNCIIYFNAAPLGENCYLSSCEYCCTTPVHSGVGNFTNDPALASATHISAHSPCIGAGSATYSSGQDIDSDEWLSPPSVGCDEVQDNMGTGIVSVAVAVSYQTVALGLAVDFTAVVAGNVSETVWDLGDGTIVSNRPYLRHNFTVTGEYDVVLTALGGISPSGVTATARVVVVEQPVFYVCASGASPSYPYGSWVTAATSIQEAIDATIVAGSVVVVSNGTYYSGGHSVYGGLTNRVCMTNAVRVQSINGASATVIAGAADPFSTNGDSAVRCAYLGAYTVLSGFTLRGGHTRTNGHSVYEQSGGGCLCEVSAVISNCIIADSSASDKGGGTYSGTLNNCTLSGNRAHDYGGGAYYGALFNCAVSGNTANVGGGASRASLVNCYISGNRALLLGGGADYCSLIGCTLTGNTAYQGGGSYYGLIRNCTLSGNVAIYGGGSNFGEIFNCTVCYNSASVGGGAHRVAANNSIVQFNSAPTGSNYFDCGFTNCCTTPMPTSGVGNIAESPQFVTSVMSAFDLSCSSPCIDAGLNQSWMTNASDIVGNPRVMNSRVDIGAFEFAFEGTLRVGIAGAYSGTAMRAPPAETIRGGAPYAADPRPVHLVASNVVDWVLVSVRTNPAAAADFSRAYFLRSDGVIVDENGRSNLLLEASGRQHLVVHHRNHLAVASPTFVLTNRVFSYDFSTGPDKYYGGTNAAVEVSPGVWAMRAGDVDGDGQIGPADLLLWQTQQGKN